MEALKLGEMSDRELLICSCLLINQANGKLDRLNGRVRDLELWRWGLTGGLGVVIVVLGFVVPWLLGKIP